MDWSDIFDGWPKLVRSLVLAALAYAALVALLRISGKRTLSKMNVFDFVFVVALGSTLAMTVLSPDISLADGVVATAALIAIQILLSRLCVHSHAMDKIVNGQPTLVVHRGKFLLDAMHRERVTEEEIRAAVRNQGLLTLDEIDSVVLETDGTFSVVWQQTSGRSSSLQDVPNHPDWREERETHDPRSSPHVATSN